MEIDYSLPTVDVSAARLAVDAPMRYGYRHLELAGTGIYLGRVLNVSLLSKAEYAKHLILGVLEMVPVLGHVVAFFDRALCNRGIQVIHLTSTDPYEMGKEQGQRLKDDIQRHVTKALPIFKAMIPPGKRALGEALKLEEHIPEDYLREMRGIADGAGVSYEQILILNTILDTAHLFGCSLYAVSQGGEAGGKSRNLTHACATNHFASQRRGLWGLAMANVDDSFRRYDDLEKHTESTTIDSLKEALHKVNYYDTVQSIVFDVNTRDIHLATAGGSAANRAFTHLKGETLFAGSRQAATTAKVVRLARNLDWPLKFLGPQTVVIVRPAHHGKRSTAIVGWAGVLGALSGINEDGTAVSISVVPSERQEGIPNQFLFRKILEEAGSVRQAQDIVGSHFPASPMNLMVAATDGIARFELDPARAKRGAAHVLA